MKQPLAYRLRPQSLDEVLGQSHILQEKGLLKRCITEKRLFSMIFFGPPGSGKTTVASILAKAVELPLKEFNAVTGNKKDLDEIFSEAKIAGQLVLVVDEVHRLNKDKQDLLLPYVEDGKVIMIGLTTANPYFSINPAIRSRCILVEFKALSDSEMRKAIDQALNNPIAELKNIKVNDEVKDALVKMSNGDVRIALNTLEVLSIVYPDQAVTAEELNTLHLSTNQNFDSSDDGYYDALSAFQKSIRGSDVDGALYYLARLIVAEDLDSIERRLLVTAYEDIGLANPALVGRAIAAVDTARRVGFPEAIIPLGDIVIDLTLSPKSKSGVNAISKALDEVKNHPLPVPPYLRLTPVNMKDDDKYDYGRPDIWAKIQYLPDGVKNLPFYVPNESSPYENTLKNNLDALNKIKRTKDLKSLK
jgi:putative ATPase